MVKSGGEGMYWSVRMGSVWLVIGLRTVTCEAMGPSNAMTLSGQCLCIFRRQNIEHVRRVI